LWLPNSTDLNPTDYKISAINLASSLPEEVQDVNGLRQRLIDVWAGVEHSIIDDDDDIDQRRRCLSACIRATGRHFNFVKTFKF